MTNPFNRADKHGAPDMRPTPPPSAETPMEPPPGLYIDGTLYPFDASRPADAELKAINVNLLAALESGIARVPRR